jgi:hypothetical protein
MLDKTLVFILEIMVACPIESHLESMGMKRNTCQIPCAECAYFVSIDTSTPLWNPVEENDSSFVVGPTFD